MSSQLPHELRLIALRHKLDALQLQIDDLQRELQTARSAMKELTAPTKSPTQAEQPAATTVPPPPSAMPPAAPPTRPTLPASVFVEHRQVNWETLIGANWLNRIGVLILLLAGAFLAHLAWQRHWINPAAQTALVFIAGAALLAAGEVFQRRNVPIFAQGLTSLGIFALYAGGFVGHHLHGLMSLQTTFILYTAITAISFLLAARTNAVAVVLLGMLGGYLTPVILSTGKDAPVELFTYLLFLNVAIAATSIAKRWDFLQLVALAATALMFAGWFFKFYEEPKRWTIETMMSLHAGLFVLAGIFPHLVLGRSSSSVACWVLRQASLAFFGVTYLLFRTVPGHHLGEFAALYAAGHWLAAGGVYAVRRLMDRIVANLLGLGAIFLTLAIPIYYSANQLAIAWSVQALVFTIIGICFRSFRTLLSATAVFALAIIWTIHHDLVEAAWRGDWWQFDARFATVAIVAAALGAAGLAYRLGRSRLAGLSNFVSASVPFVMVALGNALLVMACVHQFHHGQLALAWTANAVIAASLARWRRHVPAGWYALAALLPAIGRFVTYQCMDAHATTWRWSMDLRFSQGLLVVAGIWLAAWLVRRRLRWEDLPDRSAVALLVGDALLLVVLGLQWDGPVLTSLLAVNALGLAAFARWQNLYRIGWAAVLAFVVATFWWATRDWADGSHLAAWPSIQEGFASGLALVAAGWLAAAIFRTRWPDDLATTLALGINLVLLAVIACQWHGYAMLALWTLDVAALWAVGFRIRHPGARLEAIILWACLLCVWIAVKGLYWPKPLAEFTLLVNPRFEALLLVALVGFAAAWTYRRYLIAAVAAGTPMGGGLWQMSVSEFIKALSNRSFTERNGDWICAVLANGVLVTALTVEVLTRFSRYAFEGNSPFENMEMARQAALSILWTGYAAAAFIGGFLLRYKPVRLLALASLGPILAKVFLIDLRDLEVIYRVLSFAVLGVVFVGISYLYQRFARRISPETP